MSAQKRRAQGRSEVERQELIAELLRLRRDGVNVDRQEAIMMTLRAQWEFGWPKDISRYRRVAQETSSNGVAS